MILEPLWYRTAPGWQRLLGAAALGPASLAWSAAVSFRNALFDLGVLRVHRVASLRVISVGNLVVGGSGKTPLTIFLAGWAVAAGERVAVLSRGFGRASTAPFDFDASELPDVRLAGDETRLIARKVPGARVWVDGDRVEAARAAQRWGATVAILDDGFQHRRLARDVDVVVEVPEAGAHVLPWGPLREPKRGLARASVVVNGQQGPRATLVVTGVRSQGGLVSLRNRTVVSLTGIARPDRFHRTLDALGARVAVQYRYPDHHLFSAQELGVAADAARQHHALLVTTEKDRERLPLACAVAVVETAVRVTAGLDELAAATRWPTACAPQPTMEEAPR